MMPAPRCVKHGADWDSICEFVARTAGTQGRKDIEHILDKRKKTESESTYATSMGRRSSKMEKNQRS